MKDYRKLLLNNIPLLDVRAPIEFKQGAFPHATNIALLNDTQRQQIGICYKQQGQAAAIALGHQLISGQSKDALLAKWINYVHNNACAHLYCFRGGMRSHLVQQWLHERGVEIPLIAGGYKALRQYVLQILAQGHPLLRISGETGVGKTEFLLEMPHMIDLEGLANHRGSAFGAHCTQQPSQINFENNLAIQLLKKSSSSEHPILIEDESRNIGQLNIPAIFMQQMTTAAVLILTDAPENRVERIYQDYVVKQHQQFNANCSENSVENNTELFNQSLLSALAKIQKRLGGALYTQTKELMQQALCQQSETLHKHWIKTLLSHYYDPMYTYQIQKKSAQILFTGSKASLKHYLQHRYP